MDDELDPRPLRRRLEALEDAPADAPERLDLRLQLAWATVLVDRAEARSVSESVLELAEARGDARNANIARRNLAYIRILEGRYREALEGARGVIERARALDDGPTLLSALDISVHCWEALGDYARAMEATLETRALAERLERPRELAWALANLGSIHRQTKDFESAERCLLEALELFRSIGYATGIPRTQTLLGGMYEEIGRWDDALAHHVEALALYRDLRMGIGEAQAFTDIGAIHERNGRLDDAAEHYRKGMQMFEAAGNLGAQARVSLRLGRLLYRRGELEVSRDALQTAQEGLEAGGREVDRLDALRHLARVHDALGPPERAAALWREAFEAQAHLHDDERRVAFERVRARMEIERAEKDAEIHRLRYVELASMQSRLLERERLAVVGDLAAGVAHEANTPLGTLGSSLDVLRRATERLAELAGEVTAAARARRAAEASLDSARAAVGRIDELVRSLKRFAKLDEADRQLFQLNDEVQSVLTLVRPKLTEGVELRTELGELPLLEGVPAQLNQALMTLLVNAAEATASGRIEIRTRAEADAVQIEVEDTGRGMSEDAIAHLFEPGFRESEGRVRFRVGLPTAASAVERHGGQITVESRLGAGTRFTLSLPRRAPTGA